MNDDRIPGQGCLTTKAWLGSTEGSTCQLRIFFPSSFRSDFTRGVLGGFIFWRRRHSYGKMVEKNPWDGGPFIISPINTPYITWVFIGSQSPFQGPQISCAVFFSETLQPTACQTFLGAAAIDNASNSTKAKEQRSYKLKEATTFVRMELKNIGFPLSSLDVLKQNLYIYINL